VDCARNFAAEMGNPRSRALCAHAIPAAVDDPQWLLQCGAESSVCFGARAFSVDERDDGNPLAPHLITAMSDVCADVDADRQQLSNRCTCPNYPSQMAGVFH